MPNDGNGFMHYVVLNEVVLGEACVIEKCLLFMMNRHFRSPEVSIPV